MRTSVILPNWNGLSQLKANLPFLLRENPDEIIIVDDFSSDESAIFIANTYPQIKLIRNEKNLNFAESVNRGVKTATGEIVCLLNTDVRPQPEFLKNAKKYFSNKSLFGISLHETNYGPSLSEFEDGFIGYLAGVESNKPQKTFWISGGSCILRKDIWDQLNGFDSGLFPFYWEDLDISYRAAKRGYSILWVPDCRVLHDHETFYKKKLSSSTLSFIKETRQLIFIWKNLTDTDLFLEHLKGIARRVMLSPGYLKVVIACLYNLPQVTNKRKIEARSAVISDREILRQTAGKDDK